MTTHEIPARIGTDLPATVASSDANDLVFFAAKAFPPGQRVELTFYPETPEAFTVQVRSSGSRLQADQRFEVRTRLINLSRELRIKLLSVFSAG